MFQCTGYIQGVYFIEELHTFPSCVVPTFFVVETAKKSRQNIQKRFSKAWRNIKMSKVSKISSQEARATAGNIEGYDFWTWLTPFTTTLKTKSDVPVKLHLKKFIKSNTFYWLVGFIINALNSYILLILFRLPCCYKSH